MRTGLARKPSCPPCVRKPPAQRNHRRLYQFRGRPLFSWRNPRSLVCGYPYAYSVWVPDYFDYLNSQNQYPAPYAYGAPYDAPPAVAQGSQQPVIINQYFGAPGPQQAIPPDTSNTTAQA